MFSQVRSLGPPQVWWLIWYDLVPHTKDITKQLILKIILESVPSTLKPCTSIDPGSGTRWIKLTVVLSTQRY